MPPRPPDYSLPAYHDDEDDHMHMHSGQSPAAVRLLTSVEEPYDARPYVLPNSTSPPLSPSAQAQDQDRSQNQDQPGLFPPPILIPPALTLVVETSSETSRDPLEQDQEQEPEKKPNPHPSPLCQTQTQHQTPNTTIRRRPVLKPATSVKLQKRTKPEHVSFADMPRDLPEIPPGVSERRRGYQQQLEEHATAAAPPPYASHGSPTFSASSPRKPHGSRDMNNSHHHDGPSYRSSPLRNYQPSVRSSHSRSNSIFDDAPSMAPPDSTYVPFAGRDGGSPHRPWTPSSRMSDYPRPPASTASYEPQDLNGSPRPGTPSSRYGGSPRRPLPPAPLFSAGSRDSRSFADDATVSIPLDGHDDDDDVFGPESDLSDARPHYHGDRDSYISAESQETLNDDAEYHDKVEHYGPAPDGAQERRGVRAPQMSRKEVQLINGELVLECKIPTILYSFLPRRDEVEFTHMRYTAVTCDPDDFVDKGYKLRQTIGRTTRETELFICVTMYNEDEIGFTRTMYAVMKNISHFCSRNRSRTWGEQGWQKIVVCIVSDGREKIHPRTLDALAAMGVYQHGIAKNFVNNRAVQAHVYEYTTQVSLDSDLKFKGAEKGIVPCQMIFCLKEKNQRKLNSHRWFFNAFGKALNPNVCILLDVGTKPGNNSLYHLWKAFDTDSSVAGACGEIKAMKGRLGTNLLNPLVASQNFEYKISNILDKPLESVFGYITVLPGALSAYRYHALQNDETGHGPLSQYFKGETLHGQHADVFTANMYLAEDRILCWELVAKRGERWVLKYVKGCVGETDVPGKFFPPPFK